MKYYLILSPNWEYNDEGYAGAGKELRIKQLFDTKEDARAYINMQVHTQKFFIDNGDIINQIIENQHYKSVTQEEVDQLVEIGFTLYEGDELTRYRRPNDVLEIYSWAKTWLLNIPDTDEAVYKKFEDILGIRLSYGYEICEVEH